MIRFLVLRLVRLVATLFVCSFVVYGALDLAPGGAIGAITGGRVLSEKDQAEIVQMYHLNDPFLQRYFTWLGHLLSGDLGQSLVTRQPVMDLVRPRLETTLLLVSYAGVLIVLIGVSLGVIAGTSGGVLDRVIVAATSASSAVPAFVAAAVLLTVFAVGLGMFPSFGSGRGFVDMIYHLTLPAVALAFAGIGYIARVARTSVLEEQHRDHVQTAISRGLTRRDVIRSHVLRNALVPITTSVGITIAGLIAGAVVVEQIFGLNGLGSLLLQSVADKDFAVVQAVALVLVGSFVIANAVVDVLYPILDPRIRKAGPR